MGWRPKGRAHPAVFLAGDPEIDRTCMASPIDFLLSGPSDPVFGGCAVAGLRIRGDVLRFEDKSATFLEVFESEILQFRKKVLI